MGHVVAMLQQLIVGQADHGAKLDRVETRLNGVESRLTGVETGLASLSQRVTEVERDIVELREAVTGYHGSVLGHGMLISELDSRVQRIETHLALPPPGQVG
jgi:chromosome condensin MukBEF ATPase and DNA-binding subunit MukB